MRLVTDVFQYCRHELPHFEPISISGYHIREAARPPVQEVAFTLGPTPFAYVEAAIRAGLDVDEFAGQSVLLQQSYNNFVKRWQNSGFPQIMGNTDEGTF